MCVCVYIYIYMGFPHSSVGKESACNAGDLGSIPGLGRSPWEGNSNPLQCSCLENPMNGGTWQAVVCGVARVRHDWTTKYTHMHTYIYIYMYIYTNKKVKVVTLFQKYQKGKLDTFTLLGQVGRNWSKCLEAYILKRKKNIKWLMWSEICVDRIAP